MPQSETRRRPRILVAEDDPALRRLLELRLTVDGYDVRTVADGADALALLADWIPEIVICDVMMPRVSGFSVCREMRARPELADIPILLLTARIFDEDIEDVMQLGGITSMNKPFNADQLNRALRAILVRADGQDQNLEGARVAMSAELSPVQPAWREP